MLQCNIKTCVREYVLDYSWSERLVIGVWPTMVTSPERDPCTADVAVAPLRTFNLF